MEVINSFPGYEFVQFGEDGKSHNMYRGEDVGFGGYVYAEPGMYGRTICFDVAGMHPASIRALNCLGEYTKNFGDLVDARLAIKHKDFEKAKTMFGGKLAPYLDDPTQAKALSSALKIAINSVFGLTAAKFDNPFRDSRNLNNQVALRGALFMVNLKHEIQDRGFKVIHCKTDSAKVVNPTPELCDFIMEYGQKYGYQFEIEHIFERICLVNNAVYIAKLAEDDPDSPGEWTATGKQFAIPYVFKTLFTKEPINPADMCETFSVKTALYLDMNETLPDVTGYEKELSKTEDKYKKGFLSDTTFEAEDRRLCELIKKGHKYQFVGKVGEFCPVKPGKGGGILCREQNGKFYAATGTTGYRWLESEMIVKKLEEKEFVIDEETGKKKEIQKAEEISGNEDIIDRSYYNKLVDDAITTISKFGDFERFASEDPYPIIDDRLDFMNIPEDANEEEGLPWD